MADLELKKKSALGEWKEKKEEQKTEAKTEKMYYKTHKVGYKRTVGDVIFNICNYTFFILFTIICIFPFYYLFINTISDNTLVSKGLINFIPQGLNLNNYINLIKADEVMQAFLVSIGR
ncbi:MAG: hypothetical protein ACI4SA_00750, partial [Lachnospiraceae bacterium]